MQRRGIGLISKSSIQHPFVLSEYPRQGYKQKRPRSALGVFTTCAYAPKFRGFVPEMVASSPATLPKRARYTTTGVAGSESLYPTAIPAIPHLGCLALTEGSVVLSWGC